METPVLDPIDDILPFTSKPVTSTPVQSAQSKVAETMKVEKKKEFTSQTKTPNTTQKKKEASQAAKTSSVDIGLISEKKEVINSIKTDTVEFPKEGSSVPTTPQSLDDGKGLEKAVKLINVEECDTGFETLKKAEKYDVKHQIKKLDKLQFPEKPLQATENSEIKLSIQESAKITSCSGSNGSVSSTSDSQASLSDCSSKSSDKKKTTSEIKHYTMFQTKNSLTFKFISSKKQSQSDSISVSSVHPNDLSSFDDENSAIECLMNEPAVRKSKKFTIKEDPIDDILPFTSKPVTSTPVQSAQSKVAETMKVEKKKEEVISQTKTPDTKPKKKEVVINPIKTDTVEFSKEGSSVPITPQSFDDGKGLKKAVKLINVEECDTGFATPKKAEKGDIKHKKKRVYKLQISEKPLQTAENSKNKLSIQESAKITSRTDNIGLVSSTSSSKSSDKKKTASKAEEPCSGGSQNLPPKSSPPPTSGLSMDGTQSSQESEEEVISQTKTPDTKPKKKEVVINPIKTDTVEFSKEGSSVPITPQSFDDGKGLKKAVKLINVEECDTGFATPKKAEKGDIKHKKKRVYKLQISEKPLQTAENSKNKLSIQESAKITSRTDNIGLVSSTSSSKSSDKKKTASKAEEPCSGGSQNLPPKSSPPPTSGLSMDGTQSSQESEEEVISQTKTPDTKPKKKEVVINPIKTDTVEFSKEGSSVPITPQSFDDGKGLKKAVKLINVEECDTGFATPKKAEKGDIKHKKKRVYKLQISEKPLQTAENSKNKLSIQESAKITSRTDNIGLVSSTSSSKSSDKKKTASKAEEPCSGGSQNLPPKYSPPPTSGLSMDGTQSSQESEEEVISQTKTPDTKPKKKEVVINPIKTDTVEFSKEGSSVPITPQSFDDGKGLKKAVKLINVEECDTGFATPKKAEKGDIKHKKKRVYKLQISEKPLQTAENSKNKLSIQESAKITSRTDNIGLVSLTSSSKSSDKKKTASKAEEPCSGGSQNLPPKSSPPPTSGLSMDGTQSSQESEEEVISQTKTPDTKPKKKEVVINPIKTDTVEFSKEGSSVPITPQSFDDGKGLKKAVKLINVEECDTGFATPKKAEKNDIKHKKKRVYKLQISEKPLQTAENSKNKLSIQESAKITSRTDNIGLVSSTSSSKSSDKKKTASKDEEPCSGGSQNLPPKSSPPPTSGLSLDGTQSSQESDFESNGENSSESDEEAFRSPSSSQVSSLKTNELFSDIHNIFMCSSSSSEFEGFNSSPEKDSRSVTPESQISDVSSVHTSDLSSFDDQISDTECSKNEHAEGKSKKYTLKQAEEILKARVEQQRLDTLKLVSQKALDDKKNLSSPQNHATAVALYEASPPPVPKRESQRKCKLNPKYASNEYKSIFDSKQVTFIRKQSTQIEVKPADAKEIKALKLSASKNDNVTNNDPNRQGLKKKMDFEEKGSAKRSCGRISTN